MMQYVLGIDSGGTKFLVRAASTGGTILAEFKGATCSHYGIGETAAARRIGENIDSCLALFGGNRADCVRIVCGAAGLDSPEDGILVQKIYESLHGFHCPIYCVNDVELAHYSATGGVGVLVLAGTGSIAFGRNKQGKEIRVGGWLRSIMGDEGSGRYIDACALQHYSRWLDGCRPDSPFLLAIQKAIGTKTRKGLMDYSVRLATPPWQSPNLGEVVDTAASAQDAYAIAILHRAAYWNFDLVREAIQQLDMQNEKNLRVGIWGSVLLNSSTQRGELARLLAQHYPCASLFAPEIDAAQSAVEVAILWQNSEENCQKILAGGLFAPE